jgi:hypothetical protein
MHSGAWAARLIVFVSFLDLLSQFPIVSPNAPAHGRTASRAAARPR